MKILLIERDFQPGVSTAAQHVVDFVFCLAQAGYQVTVLTRRQLHAIPSSRSLREETHQGIDIVHVYPLSFYEKKKWAQSLNDFFLNLAFFWKMLWMSDFGTVIVSAVPSFTVWAASHFARCRKQKFFLWIMELKPDPAAEGSWFKRDTFLTYFFQQKFKDVLNGSERVIAPDRFIKKRLVDKGIDPQKIEICSLWADEAEWLQIPKSENPFCKEHGLEDKFVVMYSGHHSLRHSLATLLKASLELKNDPSILFLFVGAGDAVQEVLDFKAAHGLSNIKHLPYQERAALRYSLLAADLNIVTMGDSVTGVAHPSKIYNVLAAGKPILYIGPRESPVADILQVAGVGDQVEQDDVAGVVHVILKTKSLSLEERVKIADQSADIFESTFSYSQGTKRLLNLIEK